MERSCHGSPDEPAGASSAARTRTKVVERPSDRQRETNGKERRFALLAAAVTNPATPPAAPGTSVLAWTAPPQSSPPPIEAVLGQTFPVAELPYPQSTRRKPLDHPPPIPLLCRIA